MIASCTSFTKSVCKMKHLNVRERERLERERERERETGERERVELTQVLLA